MPTVSSPASRAQQGRYVLQTPAGPTCSRVRGGLGGNRRLRIYGRLDCPSALRHLERGHYAAVRVFFKDEATAVACGYRPCGVCMPEAYRAWKEGAKPRGTTISSPP